MFVQIIVRARAYKGYGIGSKYPKMDPHLDPLIHPGSHRICIRCMLLSCGMMDLTVDPCAGSGVIDMMC